MRIAQERSQMRDLVLQGVTGHLLAALKDETFEIVA